MLEQGIRSMFDLRDNNTWVFLGGSSVSGNAQDIGGARGYVALFEEYIRWTVAWECEGDAARQRYVINAGYSGCNLKKALDTFEKRVSVLDPAAVSYMAGIEDMQSEDSIKNFSKQLKELLEKILALRNNTAQAVIQTPYSKIGTENLLCADLTAQIIAVKASLPKEKSERVTVVNHFDCTNNPAFHAIYLNSNGSLNPRGNLEIARQLALATVGDANGHPFECTYSMQPKATPWNIFSQELSQIKALSTAQKRIFALLNDKEHSASWLIVGDSIPHGIQRIGAYDGIAQHLEKYLKCDCERYEDLVINTAVSGATTAMTLGALSSRVIKYKADVALLMLGTNDAHTNKTPKEGGTGKGHTPEQFKINMRLLLDALIEKNPDVLILLSTPVPTKDILRTDVPKLACVIRELAKEAAYRDSTILIDQYAYFDALFSKQPEVFKILPDGLHPDARGHLILIQGLLFACGLFDKESRLFKLSYELPCAIPAHFFDLSPFLTGSKGGYFCYRIPGIVVTKHDTLLAYCEARMDEESDWGAIDIMLRRSTDGGNTWSDGRLLADGSMSGVTMNNPVMIVDNDGETIHMLYCAMYGVTALGGSVFYRKSTDDGVSWSAPRDIGGCCFPTDGSPRNVFAMGPGHGIHLKNGVLLVPVWFTPIKPCTDTAHGPSVVSTLYSLDGGETWTMGEIIHENEGGSELHSPNETTVAQLSDGSVMLNMRSNTAFKKRAVTISKTGYSNWSKPVFDEALSDPGCFGSLISYDEHTLLFSHAAVTQRPRRNVSVKMSIDDGKTWIANRPMDPCNMTTDYSDIAVDSHGMIYNLFEYDSCHSIKLARFTLDWLKEGTDF